MAKVVSSFTMSLDGFIAEPNDDVGRFFKWYTNGDTPFPLPNSDIDASTFYIFGGLLPHIRCDGTTPTTRQTYENVSLRSAAAAEPAAMHLCRFSGFSRASHQSFRQKYGTICN